MLKLQLLRTQFNNDYIPNPNSRNTTNLVNLSRNPTTRKKNIDTLFSLINKTFNSFLNIPEDEIRYEIQIDIITALAWFENYNVEKFPISEMLDIRIFDTHTKTTIQGPIGLNFSSYLRDYDFNVVLPKIIKKEATKEEEDSFGLLHGIMFQMQFKNYAEAGILDTDAIIAISVSSNRTYTTTQKKHPVLGINYVENGEDSYTASYFRKMGLEPSYYMASGMCAPLAFYHKKNGLENRDPIQLWALIAVMDNIQKIYRPEIYASNKIAGEHFKPSLTDTEFTRPSIYYDREERDQTLVAQQAAFVKNKFLDPYKSELQKLLSNLK